MAENGMQRRIVDGLYLDAMLLADEARDYFEQDGRGERDGLDPYARVRFGCESLRVTTRLMHVLAFLLTRRAVDAGEITPSQAAEPSRRLSPLPASDDADFIELPPRARMLAQASIALHQRAAAFDRALATGTPRDNPALAMQRRLAASL